MLIRSWELRKIKVLYVNKLYYPHIGGVEKNVQDLAEGLRDKVEVSLLVCQDKGWGRREIINDVVIFRANSIGIYLSMPISFSLPFLLKTLTKDKDIIHFHLPFPLGVFSYLNFNPKQHVVCTYHSDIVRQKFLMGFYKPFLLRFLGRADRIIVSSPNVIESSQVLKNFKSKCTVIPFGIDPARFRLTSEISERAEQFTKRIGSPIILFIGRLVYYKGLEYLIKAMEKINGKLLIIGQGPLEKRLRRLSKTSNVLNKIIWLNRVDNRDLILYYHSCDIFVLPSIEITEAFGIVQLEAQACGKPVVSTNLTTGVPFVNLHEKTGLVVPPRDPAALAQAINKLLNEPILREKYGRNGKERVEKEFTKEVMIEKTFNLYREVLDS